MSTNVRKFVVGLAVFSVVLAGYLGYLRTAHNPDLDVDANDLMPAAVREPIESDAAGGVGRIGDIGIRNVGQTRFFHRDLKGNVDREFGFDELIHSEEDQWTITNPYMKLFLGDIRVRVTADSGKVKVETDTSFGRPSPDNAEFSGNVVIRLIASDPNDARTLFIYLDDVAFIADQSLFSTTGAVKFVSRSAQLVGQGMDLIYDELAQQLQLFRIKDLDALRLRSDQFGSLSDMEQREGKTEGTSSGVARPTVVTKTKPTDPNTTPAAGDNAYECIFYRNVTITTPEQKVTARDRLAIGNILWSGSEPNEATDAGEPAAAKVAAAPTEPNESESLAVPGPGALDTSPSESLALEAIPESFFDVVVTCDDGFVIAPKGSRYLTPDPNEWNLVSVGPTADANQPFVRPVVDPNRQTLIAHRIEIDATTTDTTLVGPVRITFAFDANDVTGHDVDEGKVPVTITAMEAVRYLAAAQRVQLEGNCAVTLEQTEPNYTYAYMLTAPTLTLDLMDDPNASPGSPGVALRRFVASGGPVAVHAQRKTGDDLVGSVVLKASKLDYEAGREDFIISGPGRITLHNGEDLDVDADPNEFSIGRPCFALMQDFDTLTYSAKSNVIVADAREQMIELIYIPEIDGSYDHDRDVNAYAGRIEIKLAPTEDNRVDLASIAALQGIEFFDSENEFQGAQLFYDHALDLITVTGDATQPCLFNGAPVDRIEMNPKTGRTKAEFQEPTMIPLRR